MREASLCWMAKIERIRHLFDEAVRREGARSFALLDGEDRMYPAPFRRSCHCGGHTNAERVRRVRATPRQRAIPSDDAVRLPPMASAVTTPYWQTGMGTLPAAPAAT